MEFKHLVEAAEKWCSGNPFELIFAEENDERRLDFYAEPGVSFYVLCPGGTDSFVSEARGGWGLCSRCAGLAGWGCWDGGRPGLISRIILSNFPIFIFLLAAFSIINHVYCNT